ncbi:bifunctional DNA primase/polymerase [Rhizobium ruizarguesonis]|uniref:bifunctional DNA primase/polymerase n=1 Tax=Rhizobium ruizarguesonis TaxID=2081791 RepID=UPI001446639C|nr:bifunctional DNA primase/polymerase [Rhizobium ruizarguesonis]
MLIGDRLQTRDRPDRGPALSQQSSSQPPLAQSTHPRGKIGASVVSEISRLFNMGYRIVPLGKGADGRGPLARFQGQKRLPLELVLQKLAETNSENYAIDLVGLVVIDVDTDTPEAHAYVERRFGRSAFVIKSPKGTHYWYRLQGGAKPKVASGNKIRVGAIAIDIKSGKNELIAGPCARRLDGGQYLPVSVNLPPPANLPIFVDKEPPVPIEISGTFASRAPIGTRNDIIIKKAVEFCGYVDSQEELFNELCALRTLEFDHPETFPDIQVLGVAKWAWQLRLEGKLSFRGRSAVKVSYDLTSALMQIKNDGPNALMLYHKAQHDHAAKRRWFALDAEKMASAKIFPFGRDAIVRATKILVKQGVLEQRSIPIVIKGGLTGLRYEYRLTGRGEGFKDYINPRNQGPEFTVIDGGVS